MLIRPDHLSPRRLAPLVSILVLLLNGCTLSFLDIPGVNPPTATPSVPSGPTATPQPSAAMTFRVALPSPLLPGETLYLSVVDEVTGLGLNAVTYAMQGMDTLHYTVAIPFALNSIIKYRYIRQGTIPFMEDDSFNKPVRYRLVDVAGPVSVDDVVASWSDSVFSSPSGRLTGQAVDATSNTPIPNILIAAGGQQTLTDSTGSFVLENLPVGTHNLVAYAIDGAYQTFQQGARIEVGQRTPVMLSLVPAQMVNVIFTLSVPDNTIQNAPIRMAGNLYQLGNTFSDLQGGLSTVATRMPALSPQQDGRSTLSIMLPAGADIRYKYTLGDGFWNAEHDADGHFVVRQLIVPASRTPVDVQDTVQTWQAGPSSPILFEVSVPATTPVTDIVSIQFNPYGWTEPIPMWPQGDSKWVYQLYSPLDMLGDFQYRYCRNDQCGIADDVQTSNGQLGRPVGTSLVPQDLQDTVTAWNWMQAPAPSSLIGITVAPRQEFMTGVEFLAGYDPTWQAWNQLAIQDVQGRYANWLVIDPSWTISQNLPFVFSPVPGVDPLWADTLDTVSRARASNLNVALFPAVNMPSDLTAWWTSASRDEAWWNGWFDRYAAFADYHADLATKSGAQALILGGDWVTPALPDGQINGSNSGVPADAEVRWRAIISDVRSRFNGKVYWALSYPGGSQEAPGFTSNLDGIYLLWYAPIGGSSVDEIKAAAGQLLDTDIQPFKDTLQKPLILAVAYSSADNTASASLPISALFQPGSMQQGPVNLQAQADVYQALLMAVNERDWVSGFVSRGYYPPVVLQDASASIHGKPAADVLWYWYPRFLGITP
ncbi:MAG TPA: carboxypeptidase regulatory-like domain-containing protein [Anaerolineales bacterium]